MTELERLKDELATVRRAYQIYCLDYKGCDWPGMVGVMEARIAKLEAKAADPHEKAKESIRAIEDDGPEAPDWQKRIARYVRHLEAVVAEIEAKPVLPPGGGK